MNKYRQPNAVWVEDKGKGLISPLRGPILLVGFDFFFVEVRFCPGVLDYELRTRLDVILILDVLFIKRIR